MCMYVSLPCIPLLSMLLLLLLSHFSHVRLYVTPKTAHEAPPSRGPGTLIPSAQRLVWAAKQPLGNAALGALFA